MTSQDETSTLWTHHHYQGKEYSSDYYRSANEVQASGSFGSFVLTSFYPYIHNHNSLVFALIFVSDVIKYKGQWYSNDNSYVNML